MALKPTTKQTCGVRHVNALAEKESCCSELWETIFGRENLLQAWHRVRSNQGAAGVDGVSIADFPAYLRQHWGTIRQKLDDGSYMPSPVKRVDIPKPDGTSRPLGIPTVMDRVIQQAMAQVLSPLWERDFSEHSYGFRPQRSAHMAVQAVQKMAKNTRKKWVVDCDLKSFFDTVNHDVLMQRIRQKVEDHRVLILIGKYLRAGVILRNGNHEETRKGMPQGGPLSPLLANILLDELDKELENRGHQFARYADDFTILCSSPRAGERVLRSITRYIESKLKLLVNRAKSKVCQLSEATFLSFQQVRGKIVWSEPAQKRFKDRVRAITKRTRGVSPAQVISELTSYIRGSVNYYAIGMPFGVTRELDGWVRQRMRLYYWKQWGRPRARRRKLLALGVPRHKVHMASRSRKGHWRISNTSLVRKAMHNTWLEEQGVPSLVKLWKAIRYPEETVRDRISKL